MDVAARRFARKILLLHLAVLALIVAVVVMAARNVYETARAEALRQAGRRQEMLASQTARGVESFYQSILENLDLLGRAENEPERAASGGPGAVSQESSVAPRVMLFGPILWKQLEDRLTNLLIVDRVTLNAHAIATGEPDADSTRIVAAARAWIANVDRPSVSRFVRVEDRGEGYNLVAAPMSARGRRLLVAVVPGRQITNRFLAPIARPISSSGSTTAAASSDVVARPSATLIDDTLAAMASSNPYVIGSDLNRSADPEMIALARWYVERRAQGTQTIDAPLRFGERTFDPRQITVVPVELPGARWSLIVSSPLSETDAVVSAMFRRTMYWAIFVACAMTAVLVSTAVGLVRNRVRLERVRHELLDRELSQARQIQLNWLPGEGADGCVFERVDIAAVNQPASHISGDFYNWFDLPDGRTVITIGDVTGHGLTAAFLMATTQLLVRAIVSRVRDPGRCLEEVNRELLRQSSFTGQFVTMLVLVIDCERGELEIATAGHPPPLIGVGDAFRELPVEPQFALGIEEDATYVTERLPLPPEASLLLYTDGVLDAQSPTGERFQLEGILGSLFGRFENAKAMLDALTNAVSSFRAGRDLGDDLTVVAIQLETVNATLLEAATAPAEENESNGAMGI